MGKYRSKPHFIEAFRLGFDDPPEWFYSDPPVSKDNIPDDGICIPRPNWMPLPDVDVAKKGDWIIKGIVDELIVMSNEEFTARYEPLPE